MRRSLLAVTAAAFTLIGTAARADLVITEPNGTGNFDANVLFKVATTTPTTTAPGFSNGPGEPQIITFTSTDAVNTSASGQADISPPAGATFNNLTLKASGSASAYSALLLNIIVPMAETVTFTSPTTIHSGATQQLSGNGNNFVLVTAENNESFNTLSLTTSGNISDIKQTRVDFAASAPEPSTWAMMIVGLLGLGFLAYGRRNGKIRFV